MIGPTQERWLPVAGYIGFYEVSNYGRVRSLARREPYRRRGPGFTRLRKGRILRASLGSNGYWTVRLRSKTRTVHSLVLGAFVGPKPIGWCGCHGPDFRTENNSLINLRWGTYSSNNKERPPFKRAA